MNADERGYCVNPTELPNRLPELGFAFELAVHIRMSKIVWLGPAAIRVEKDSVAGGFVLDQAAC